MKNAILLLSCSFLIWQSNLLAQNVVVDSNLVTSGDATVQKDISVLGSAHIEDRLLIEGRHPEGGLAVKALRVSALDQSQTSGSIEDDANSSWQSFTAGISGQLVKAEFFFDFASTLMDYRLRIYKGQGTGGTLCYNQQKTFGNSGGNVWRNWDNIDLEIDSGAVYTLRVTARCCGGSFAVSPGIKYSNANPYPDGISSKSDTSDFRFRTHVRGRVDALAVDADGRVLVAGGAADGFVAVSDTSGAITWTDPTTITTADDWENAASDIYFNGGNVGVGTNSPQSSLHIRDTRKDAIQLHTTDNNTPAGISWHYEGPNYGWSIYDLQSAGLVFANIPSGDPPDSAQAVITFDDTGDRIVVNNGARCNSSGTWVDASDLARKYDVEELNYGLNEVMTLEPKAYSYKIDQKPSLGFIAQEMRQVIPEVVSGDDGNLGIAYGPLVAVLTNAIQEQQQMIEELQEQVRQLTEKVDKK